MNRLFFERQYYSNFVHSICFLKDILDLIYHRSSIIADLVLILNTATIFKKANIKTNTISSVSEKVLILDYNLHDWLMSSIYCTRSDEVL